VSGDTLDGMVVIFCWSKLCEGRYSGCNGCDGLLELAV
jgi:hypothetical protein